jgi:hypothetical protein
MAKLLCSPKSKEIDRRELEKHLKQDAKSEQNPKGGFRQKLIKRGVF